MTEVEKRARIEILEMLIEHELSLGYKDFDVEATRILMWIL